MAMTRISRLAAADLGATSGRVVLGEVGTDTLRLQEVHRFGNRAVSLAGTLHWDMPALYLGVLDGVRAAARAAAEAGEGLDGVGIDSWAVDYGLLDERGALLGLPVSYRDSRTQGVAEHAERRVPAAAAYARTGLQYQPFNTVYQLLSEQGSARLAAARQLLLVPDLLGFWLTGATGAEVTNASTTQLLDATTRTWARDLVEAYGLDPALLPPLRQPGDVVGHVLPEVAEDLGLAAPLPVFAVGSHDTASAVVAVPAVENAAYVSCGTWSLVGLELDAPVLTEESRRANFTNELGVDGTVRYLRNVMGLWLLTQSMRTWERKEGRPASLADLLLAAEDAPACRSVIDPDRAEFLPPGDMPARIVAECERTGQPVPRTPAEVVRCILDSLALAYRRAVRQAAVLAGRHVDAVHIVGGGSQNRLLCRLTADACGLPVVAGPVEASAIGNLLVQARAVGAVSGGLPDLRALIRRTQELVRFDPLPGGARNLWDGAERRAYPG